jgi:hypothetical protein
LLILTQGVKNVAKYSAGDALSQGVIVLFGFARAVYQINLAPTICNIIMLQQFIIPKILRAMAWWVNCRYCKEEWLMQAKAYDLGICRYYPYE